MALGIVLVCGMIASATWMVLDRRAAAFAAANREAEILSVALTEQTSRVFDGVDFILLDMLQRIRAAGIETPETLESIAGTPEIYRIVSAEAAALSQIDAITIVDASGRVVNFSRHWPPPEITLNDRDYFQALRDDPGLRHFIGVPVASRGTGLPTIYLARRIEASDGRFLGIVLGAIRVDYFMGLYGTISEGEGRFVGLRRADGRMLLRYPQPDRPIDALPADDELLAATLHGTRTSSDVARSPVNGLRIIRVARVLKDFPIVVTIGRTQAAILADWRQQAWAIGAGVALAAAVLLAAFIMLANQIARRVASESALAMTLEHMSQGIAMVDDDGHVPVWNRRLLEMLDIPPKLMVPKLRLRDRLILQLRNDKSFQNQKNNVDAIRAFLGLEQVPAELQTHEERRADGRVLEITNVPLKEGGAVRTYTDVTVARRRESALQAALHERDLADKAMRRQRENLDHELAERTRPLAESEARHRDAAEIASDWIWETDQDNRLTFVSKRFGDTSGLEWRQAQNQLFGDLVKLGFESAAMNDLLASMEARETYQNIVCAVVPAGGLTRFWKLSGKPYFQPETGTFVGYRGSGTDVTARIEAESVLNDAVLRAEAAERQARRDRERLLDAIEAIPVGFVLHDADDRMVLCNTRYGEIQGLTPDLMTEGTRFEDVLRASQHVPEGDRREDWVARRLNRRQGADATRLEQYFSDGRWIEVIERRKTDGDIVGVQIDVTEARQREAAERDLARATAELRAARLLQSSLLPSLGLRADVMANTGLEIASRVANCTELGGDLWGMSDLDGGRAGIYIVDFAGHGTAAALNTFRLHTLIHELRSAQLDPGQLLTALNKRMAELLPPGSFATMFYCIADPSRDRLTYAAAGSPPPIVRCGGNQKLISLDSSGLPIGITRNAEYGCNEIGFGPGAMLFLYSDILTDFVDENGEHVGEAGAFAMIREAAMETTAEAMVERVCAPFLNQQTIPLTDDLTAVCIMRKQ